MEVLTRLAACGLFLLLVWVLLLVLGRRAVLACSELRAELTSWARPRCWSVGTEPMELLAKAAGAERVIMSARGEVRGCECTVLYCTAFESSFGAFALRLPGTSGRLTVRRRRRLGEALARVRQGPEYHAGLPEPAVYDRGFDRAYRVVTATGDAAALVSPQVRQALVRAAETVRVRELRIVDDLVLVTSEPWAMPAQLDPLVDVLAAVAQAGQAGPPPRGLLARLRGELPAARTGA